MLASFFSLVAGVLAAGQGPSVATTPIHRVSIDVLGPIAQVQVERELVLGEQGTKTETVLDLDLPAGASIVDWSMEVAGRPLKLTPVTRVKGHESLAAALAAQNMAPATSPSDETAVRVHVAPLAGAVAAKLRYKYAAPLSCAAGRLALRIPASLDAEPSPAQVTVQFKLPESNKLAEATVAGVPVKLGKNGRAPVVHLTAPRRAAWELTFALRGGAGPFGNASAAWSSGQGREPSTLAVAVCRPERPANTQLPEELVLLVDRSRSVGSGGMADERDLGRALLEALPPTERFNAFLFARTAAPIFPVARTATREAMDAFTAAADPNRLENGTNLVAALESVAAWIKTDPAKHPRLLAIITDGAIPESQNAERLAAALSSAGPGNRLSLLILMVRPAADEPVSEELVERLSRFAGHYGGLVRVLSAQNAREVVRSSVAAMGQGGDLFNLQLAGTHGAALSGHVGPGQGFVKVLSGPRSANVRLTGEYQGTAFHTQLVAARPSREWLLPLRQKRMGQAWSGQAREAHIHIEEILAQGTSSGDGVVRGQMDPMVLRNALSLAFLPRARACYLSRRVGNSGDLNLQGRVRLELHLERGELEDAVIGGASTLNRPEIERCVRDAAFEIEYPRPIFRNAPTVAALNLVFRPTSMPEGPRPDASQFDREIDLILGPVSFDPKKLLEEETEAAGKNSDRKSSGE